MIKHGLIWITALVLAFFAGQTAMGSIAKNRAPAMAVTLSPVNGFAAEKLASKSVVAAVTANQGQFPERISSKAVNWARVAFLAEPVTPQAVATLALNQPLSVRRKLMQQAYALSRREQLVTGWIIADSGAREDIPGILSAYDTMLRTSSSSAAVVIPVMAGALANERFVAPFATLLSQSPPWASQFWGTLAGTPDSLVNGAVLREQVYRRSEDKNIYRDDALIAALVNEQQFGAAARLYGLLAAKSGSGSLLKNGSFDREPEYAPLDWQLFSTGEYGAAITNGNLQLSAIPNSGGLFARQLVRLPASVLTLTAETIGAPSADGDIVIGLSCAETRATPPQPIRIKLSEQKTVRQIGNQRSGCSYYWLDITGRASENGSGFDAGLKSLSLTRAG